MRTVVLDAENGGVYGTQCDKISPAWFPRFVGSRHRGRTFSNRTASSQRRAGAASRETRRARWRP
eukprot:6557783-Lingulodinium_polyedra.AAC.1